MDRRKQRRMSKSAIVYVPIGILLIVLLTIFGTNGFVKVTEIIVVGATVYSDEEIIAVSGILPGDNLLFIDVSIAERRILTAMPFINAVEISRKPPDMIRIEVKESTALASVAYQNDVLIIDSTGRVLERSGSMPDNLIEIWGISPVDAAEGTRLRAEQGGEMRLQYMLDVLAALERESIQDGVSYLDVSNISQINFGYLGRFRIVLGGPNDLRQKLTSLNGAIEGIEEIEPTGVTGTFRAEPTGKWIWTPD